MMVVGVPVEDGLLREIATRLRADGFDLTADQIDKALTTGQEKLVLSVADRAAMLIVLAEIPNGFGPLFRALQRDLRHNPDG